MSIQKTDIFDDSETNTVVNQVQAFQKLTAQLRRNIEDLHAIKKAKSEGNVDVKAKFAENYSFLVKSRKNLRELYLVWKFCLFGC